MQSLKESLKLGIQLNASTKIFVGYQLFSWHAFDQFRNINYVVFDNDDCLSRTPLDIYYGKIICMVVDKSQS